MKVNIKGLWFVANSYLRTLISVGTLSIMIALGIQLIGRHFDNAWKTGCRSFPLFFPMTMKTTSMPFCHMSNTIKVYKGYYEEHKTNIMSYIHKQRSCHYIWFNGKGGSIERKGIPCFDSFQSLLSSLDWHTWHYLPNLRFGLWMLGWCWKLTHRFSSLFYGGNITPFPLLMFILCRQEELLHVYKHNVGSIF
jgi:hypothetical protein